MTSGLRQIARNATNDELVMGFDESDTNFTLYFQVGVACFYMYIVCVCAYICEWVYVHIRDFFVHRFVPSVLTQWEIGVSQSF